MSTLIIFETFCLFFYHSLVILKRIEQFLVYHGIFILYFFLSVGLYDSLSIIILILIKVVLDLVGFFRVRFTCFDRVLTFETISNIFRLLKANQILDVARFAF